MAAASASAFADTDSAPEEVDEVVDSVKTGAKLNEELAKQGDDAMFLRKTFTLIDQGQIEEGELRLTKSITDFSSRQASSRTQSLITHVMSSLDWEMEACDCCCVGMYGL
jgi:hypothetical protein